MVEYGMTLAAALSLIKQGRNRINPNPGFRKQLQEFERKVKKLRAEGRIEKPSEIHGQIGSGPNGLGEGLIIHGIASKHEITEETFKSPTQQK